MEVAGEADVDAGAAGCEVFDLLEQARTKADAASSARQRFMIREDSMSGR